MKSLKEAKMKEEAARMNKLREEAKGWGSRLFRFFFRIYMSELFE